MAKRKKNDPCPAVFRTDYERIREDLIDQLERNGTVGGHYIDLVNDYMNMWILDTEKAKLIAANIKQGSEV